MDITILEVMIKWVNLVKVSIKFKWTKINHLGHNGKVENTCCNYSNGKFRTKTINLQTSIDQG